MEEQTPYVADGPVLPLTRTWEQDLRRRREELDLIASYTPARQPWAWAARTPNLRIDGVDTVPGDLIDLRNPPRIGRGAQFLCAIPPELGPAVKLRKVNGRVVARTESGIDMILPRAPACAKPR